MSADTKHPIEMTWRVIILSVIITLMLASANAYLALRLGTTISASIPASIMALGILHFFKNSSILESNLIQTSASAGEGVAAAVSFTLPAMVVLHYWLSFPFLGTVLITLCSGLLGVFLSVPLRRVLLGLPDLRFPEGTAIGHVLLAKGEASMSLKDLFMGVFGGALITFSQLGLRVIAGSLDLFRLAGNTVYGLSLGFSPATFAAGYIVGPEVALSLLLGVLISWVFGMPLISSHLQVPHLATAQESAMQIWSNYLRFMGVGTMLIGGLWTLLTLMKPVYRGIVESMALIKHHKKTGQSLPRTDTDISFLWVVIGSFVFLTVLFVLILMQMESQHLFSQQYNYYLLGFFSIAYVMIIGFLAALMCGYFAGLVGSTNNPLSGVLIIAILLLSFFYSFIFHLRHEPLSHQMIVGLVSVVIIVATILSNIACITNDNIQDLKAGQMVGATPWRQQLMLSLGVIVSSIIIAPVLNLLFQAYGIGGVFPRPGMSHAHMLAAPQAGMMAAVARGVLTHHLNWTIIEVGMVIGIILVCIDEFLKTKGHRLPVLAVGLGIYLPSNVLTPMILGGLVAYFVNRSKSKQEAIERSSSSAMIVACGLVAGSSLMGVLLAIPFVIKGSSDALVIMPKAWFPASALLAVAQMALLSLWLFKKSRAS